MHVGMLLSRVRVEEKLLFAELDARDGVSGLAEKAARKES